MPSDIDVDVEVDSREIRCRRAGAWRHRRNRRHQSSSEESILSSTVDSHHEAPPPKRGRRQVYTRMTVSSSGRPRGRGDASGRCRNPHLHRHRRRRRHRLTLLTHASDIFALSSDHATNSWPPPTRWKASAPQRAQAMRIPCSISRLAFHSRKRQCIITPMKPRRCMVTQGDNERRWRI